MKNSLMAAFAAAALLFVGCQSSDPIYYEELSEEETKELVSSARELALEAKAMPENLRGVFAEMEPVSVRIHYTGSKRGKASIRWEIYEPQQGARITQKDVNPYWIMVYAIGDLDDPEWKVNHAAMGDIVIEKSGKSQPSSNWNNAQGDLPGYAAPPPRKR